MEKRYDHQSAEKKASVLWKTLKTYTFKGNTKNPYTIDTPPPTVSGTLHIGHIFSYTQTDIIARYKRLQGFDVFYPFGFDDNGLPTEKFVEKKHNIRAQQLSRTDFINLCIKEAAQAAKKFQFLWEQMGLSVDWSQTYATIAKKSRLISQDSFITLYKKGYIYRQQEPALYCTACRTAVAQAELDDMEKPSLFNDIIFKDEQGNDLVVATTRPELLPSCVALLYHPNDDRYNDLKNTNAQVPLFNFTVPIIADEMVSMEKGTGLVMVCTFGDKNDIHWYKKHQFPYRQSIGHNGRFTALGQFLEGMNIQEARKIVIEKLREKNLLYNQKTISHAVNVHERCKKEIEYIVLSQWFIAILPYKKQLLQLADEINWHPSFMKTRYIDWVTNLSWDWCISRQRFYGIAFPVWHCADCNHIILAKRKELPVDPQEISPPDSCPECGKHTIVPDTDVMDTWNTSSLTPYICQNIMKQTDATSIPMSLRPQAHDIIRTWAFYTIIKTWMHDKKIPWHDIVISGHVLSKEHKKLSKKEGNALAPETILGQYPADAIRYWTASAKLGYDVQFSQEQLKIGLRLINKLWNAFRFFQPHIIDTTDKPVLDEHDHVSKWLLHKVSSCYTQYQTYLDQYEYSLALQVIEDFFWKDFCDNYIELVKHRLFNPTLYTESLLASTKWTLYHTGKRILQLFAPFIPFVTETLFQEIYEKEKTTSLHTTVFANIQTAYDFTKEATDITHIIAIIGHVRRLKTEQQLSLKTPIKKLTVISSDNEIVASIAQQEQLLRGITHADSIVGKYGQKSSSTCIEKDGQWHIQVYV